MRFIIPSQTIAEYRHQQMPVFETWGAIASTAISVGASYASSQLNKKGGGGGGRGGGGAPSYSYDPQTGIKNGQDIFRAAADQSLAYAPEFTQANINLQNKVTPGSSAQRQLAQNQINSYIQGQIPQDVQQQINRQVAQNLGGGFNLFSGGGQAPQNFSRNLGQTSLGLSQYGLSAAPTWQQLANSMVASPTQLLGSAINAQQIGSGVGLQTAENQYQSAMNQYGAQQAQNQFDAQLLNKSIGMGLDAYGSINKANYLNSLTDSRQGALATLGGLPSASGYSAYAQPSGAYYQPGTSVMVPSFG